MQQLNEEWLSALERDIPEETPKNLNKGDINMSNTKNKAADEVLKGFEDAVAFGKEAVDAVMKSNAIFVKGVQDINTALFGLAQSSMEDSVAATQKIFGCKTVADVMDAQAELAQSNYAKALDDGRKISDLSVKVAEAASKPITKQVNAAVEKFSKPIAA